MKLRSQHGAIAATGGEGVPAVINFSFDGSLVGFNTTLSVVSGSLRAARTFRGRAPFLEPLDNPFHNHRELVQWRVLPSVPLPIGRSGLYPFCSACHQSHKHPPHQLRAKTWF